LQQASGRVVLSEIRGTEFVSVSGAELLDQVARARAYLRGAGLQTGDRCALLGPNSIRWAAIDLALMAENIVVVPLYSRQAPAELAAMMKDCTPRLLIASDAAVGESVAQAWPEAPRRATFDEVLQSAPAQKGIAGPPNPRRSEDFVTIIYTSGTSGEPKGVCLNTRNLDHMLPAPPAGFDRLDKNTREPLRVFQYLPLFRRFVDRHDVLRHARNDSYLSTDLNSLPTKSASRLPTIFSTCPRCWSA